MDTTYRFLLNNVNNEYLNQVRQSNAEFGEKRANALKEMQNNFNKYSRLTPKQKLYIEQIRFSMRPQKNSN